MTSNLSVTTHRWTVSDFHRLAEAGILTEDIRVELIDGQLIDMSPIGDLHAACVKRLNDFLGPIVRENAILGIQDPIILDDFSEPQPDVSILHRKRNYYADGHPRPTDILLLIEVADSSAEKDKKVKLPLYGKSGIPECWLINLNEGLIEQYLEPSPDGYRTIHFYRPGEVIESEVIGSIAVADLIPE